MNIRVLAGTSLAVLIGAGAWLFTQRAPGMEPIRLARAIYKATRFFYFFLYLSVSEFRQ